jgi:hypothetical protein
MVVRAPHLILVAIASLAIGVFVGTVLSDRITGVVSAAASAPVAPTAGATPVDPSPGIPTLADAPSPNPREPATAPTRGTELPEVPAAEPELGSKGSSAVTGSISTLEGAPVPGVELDLELPKDAPKYQPRHATSDSAGRFEFSGLPRGEWRITGRHRKFSLQRRNGFPPLVPTGASVEFIACPAVPVDVRVTGESAERARVAFRRANEGEPQWSSWTTANTTLALSPGAWELCASVDAMDNWPSDRNWQLAPLASAVSTVHVGGSDSEVITLALEKTRCLYGTVRLPVGYQWNEVNGSDPAVRLIESRSGTPADFESVGDRLSRQAEIDHEGRFGFFALPYERWTAGVTGDWGTPQVVQVVDVPGLTRIDLEMNGDGESSVLVDAFTAGGDRITSGISFSFIHRDPRDKPSDYLWQGAHTVLDQAGTMRVVATSLDKNYREKAAKKHDFVLQATLPGFARIQQPLSGLKDERLRLSFVPGAELEVALDGDGADRAMRKCAAEIDSEDYHEQGVFDETVHALKFASLTPGSYMLTVSVWGSSEAGQWRMVQLHKGEVAVRPGTQRITLNMPTRADLVVRCPGVKKDVRATLNGPLLDPTADREEHWWAPQINGKVDGSAQVTFDNVVPGRYRLTIGQRMQLITVPCGPVEFAGRIPERNFFRLQKGDSPLRRAGLRSGDIYIGLDGEAVAIETAQKRIRALGSQKEGTLRLTVERDGRPLDLVVDASSVDENESIEISFEPVLE